MSEKRKKLPITIQSDYYMNQGYALPLCILLKDDFYRNWYHVNYLMPHAFFRSINDFYCEIYDALEYGWKHRIDSHVLVCSYTSKEIMQKVDNIYDVISKRICSDYYCIIFLDHYYLEGLPEFYHKSHYAHEILVYGFDDVKKNILVSHS